MKLLIMFFLFLPNAIIAQKVFSLKVVIPDNMNEKSFVIYYENGVRRTEITPNFKDKQCVFSDSFYSRYATIMIAYRDKNIKYREYNNFWITDAPATITFMANSVSPDPLSKRKLINAIEVSQMGEDKLNAFKAKEVKDFQDFYFANEGKIAKNDSKTVKIYHEKSQRINDKYMAFIKKNGSLLFILVIQNRDDCKLSYSSGYFI